MSLRQDGRVELFGLAGAGEEHPLRGDIRGVVEKRQFQSLSGDFAGSRRVGSSEPLLLPALENETISASASICSSGLLSTVICITTDCAAIQAEFQFWNLSLSSQR